MLTVQGQLDVPGFSAWRDVAWRGGEPELTPRFYLLRSEPRLVVEDDGGPALHLTRYLPEPGSGELGAGSLRVAVELGWGEDEAPAIRDALAAATGIEAETVELVPFPALGGTITLAVLAEEEDGEFVRTGAGEAPASLLASQRASFFVDLTGEGAALAKGVLTEGEALLHARYELEFEHRLVDATLHAWAEAGALADDLAELEAPEELLIERGLAGVDLEVDGASLPEEQRDALTQLGTDAIRRFLRDDPRGRLDLRWTSDAILRGTTSVAANLGAGLSPEQLESRVVEHPPAQGFFSVVQLELLCQPFGDEGLVAAVDALVRYPAGDADARRWDVAFGPEGGRATFVEQAQEGERELDVAVRVHHRNLELPWTLEAGTAQAGEVFVLDADRLGLFRADVSLGRAPMARVEGVDVELEIPELGLSHRGWLGPGTDSLRWTTVVRQHPAPPARVRAVWHRRDDEDVTADWAELGAGRTWLDAPFVHEREAEVSLLAAGDWAELRKIVLSVREPGGAPTSFELTAFGQRESWTTHAEGAPVSYEHRAIFFYADGDVREVDWAPAEGPLLVVADPGSFAVTVVPTALFLGDLRRARVELARGDDRKTFVFAGPGPSKTWRLRLPESTDPTYRHRLTVWPPEGPPRQGDWHESRSELLVPAPPAEP